MRVDFNYCSYRAAYSQSYTMRVCYRCSLFVITKCRILSPSRRIFSETTQSGLFPHPIWLGTLARGGTCHFSLPLSSLGFADINISLSKPRTFGLSLELMHFVSRTYDSNNLRLSSLPTCVAFIPFN